VDPLNLVQSKVNVSDQCHRSSEGGVHGDFLWTKRENKSDGGKLGEELAKKNRRRRL
jgi:hypothetical protein